MDQCQFGRPYRKRTVIWGFPSGLLDGLSKTCDGSHVHTVTLSRWGGGRNSADAKRSMGTEDGSSAYPQSLCVLWRQVMLQNLDGNNDALS